MGKGSGSGEGWGESDTKGGQGEWKHGLCGSCSPLGDCKCAYLKHISSKINNIPQIESVKLIDIFLFFLVAQVVLYAGARQSATCF